MPTADSAVVGSFLTQINYGDSAARIVAVKRAPLVGTDLILPLGMVYAGSDQASGKAAYEAIKKIVYNAGRPGAVAEAKSAADQLLRLAAPEYPRFVRADALELLGVVASDTETSALGALIDDKDVGEDARMALERIPGKAADDALKAAARTGGKARKDAIDLSLRHRKLKRNEVGIKK